MPLLMSDGGAGLLGIGGSLFSWGSLGFLGGKSTSVVFVGLLRGLGQLTYNI